MRFRVCFVAIAALPLMAAACTSATKVENVTITNDMAANATAPVGDVMANDTAPAAPGNDAR